MTHFHIKAVRERNDMAEARTWQVAAANLFDALSLIPDAYAVKTVDVLLDTASEPRIGSSAGRRGLDCRADGSPVRRNS